MLYSSNSVNPINYVLMLCTHLVKRTPMSNFTKKTMQGVQK